MKERTVKGEMKDPFYNTAKNLNQEMILIFVQILVSPNVGKFSTILKCCGMSSSIPKNREPNIDLPMAIMKPVRLSTKYMMSKFMSYSNFSSFFVVICFL